MFKKPSIRLMIWAAGVTAAWLFIATPFLLIDHNHLGSGLSEQCALCTLASTAFDSPDTDQAGLFALACSGDVVASDDARHIVTPPTHRGVRAPPSA